MTGDDGRVEAADIEADEKMARAIAQADFIWNLGEQGVMACSPELAGKMFDDAWVDAKSPTREKFLHIAQVVHAALAAADRVSGEPVAWKYELATHINTNNTYGGWSSPKVSLSKPNVPAGSIRNLIPLYASPSPDTAAAVEAERDNVALAINRTWNNLNRPEPLCQHEAKFFADAAIAALREGEKT